MNAIPEISPKSLSPTMRVIGLSKRYGEHLALDHVALDLLPGQVHVLFGENGAGKSTLISMLAGALEPSAGAIEIDGARTVFASVADARSHGVRAVFQEFSLVPMLTVGENILLGEEPEKGCGILAKSAARLEALRLIEQLGFSLDVDERVQNLPRGKQQMVEICKALRRQPRVLILDEPTASLSEQDAQALFVLIRRLKADGVAIVYITHRMHEISELGDCVTVLRDGRKIATVAADTPDDKLIELMTGRSLSGIYPPLNDALGEVRLCIQHLCLAPEPGAAEVINASLNVRAGEIVGIAGLVGCGKSELAQACFGLKRIAAGSIFLDGQPAHFKHPADAIAQGLWYSPADRKHDGLALGLAAGQNISISALRFGELRGAWLRPKRERKHLIDLSARVDFAGHRLHEHVANFSGGNQQKVLLAKGLAQDINVYIFDEPTVGVDVGARLAIYRCLVELSRSGAAILLVSSDLAELLGMTHRMLIMNKGRVVREFNRSDYNEQHVLEHFF